MAQERGDALMAASVANREPMVKKCAVARNLRFRANGLHGYGGPVKSGSNGGVSETLPPSSGEAVSGVRVSEGALRIERRCKSCDTNLEGKPRTKNADGDYRCMPCHRRRKAGRGIAVGVRRYATRAGAVGLMALVFAFMLVGLMRSCGQASEAPSSAS